jgi:hypothetical protein
VRAIFFRYCRSPAFRVVARARRSSHLSPVLALLWARFQTPLDWSDLARNRARELASWNGERNSSQRRGNSYRFWSRRKFVNWRCVWRQVILKTVDERARERLEARSGLVCVRCSCFWKEIGWSLFLDAFLEGLPI